MRHVPLIALLFLITNFTGANAQSLLVNVPVSNVEASQYNIGLNGVAWSQYSTLSNFYSQYITGWKNGKYTPDQPQNWYGPGAAGLLNYESNNAPPSILGPDGLQHLQDNHHRLSGIYLLTTIFTNGYSQDVTVTNPAGIVSTITIGAAPTNLYLTQIEARTNMTMSNFWFQLAQGNAGGVTNFAPVTTNGSDGFWNSTNQPTYLWTYSNGIPQNPNITPPPMLTNLVSADDTLRDVAAQITFPRDYGFSLVGYQPRDGASSNNIQSTKGNGEVLYYQEFWWANYLRPLVYLIPTASNIVTAGMNSNAPFQFTDYGQLVAFSADFLSHSSNAINLPGYYDPGLLSVDFPAFRPGSSVLIRTNGTLDVSGSMIIDNAATLTVQGSLSVTNQTFYVGSNTGNNSMIINNGGAVTNNNAVIGFDATSTNNMLTVTGAGSLWNLFGDLVVGEYGSGNRLVISNGGQVTNGLETYGAIVGFDTLSSNNSVLVTGADSNGAASTWSSLSYLEVGYGASGNSLVVSNGGFVTTFIGVIGDGTNASQNAALIDGVGSLWSNANILLVGVSGRGNELVVTNGGGVFSIDGSIGVNASASNNSATISGNGSLWSNSGSLTIGYGGSLNSLTIKGGASVASVQGYLGRDFGSRSNLVLVSGEGSLWMNSGDLAVGQSGSGNSLVISSGGSVSVGGSSYIGYDASSSNNSVSVTSNSLWSNSGDLNVGYSGSYNSLTISGSSTVTDVNGSIGDQPGAIGVAWITNALWIHSNQLSVGRYGTGSMSIGSGATIVDSNACIGAFANSSGSVSMDGGLWTNTFGFSIGFFGSGSLTLAGGTISSYIVNVGASTNSVGSLIMSGGNLADSKGTIGYSINSTGSAIVSGGIWTNSGALVIGASGNGSLTLSSSGTVIANDLLIATNSGSKGTLNIGSLGGSDTSGTLITPTITFGSGSGTINFNQKNSYTLTSSITGSGSINQLGSGTTILSGSNSYTGRTALTSGTLVAASTNALGASDVSLGGTAYAATLRLATNLKIITGAPPHYDLNWGSNGVIALAQGTHTLTLAGGMTNSAGTNAGANAFQFLNSTLSNDTNILINFASQSGFTTNSFSVKGVSGYSFGVTSSNVTAFISPNANLAASESVAINQTLTVGSLTIFPTGSLSGSGTLVGTLNNGGLLSPGNEANPTGTFTITGNFIQTGTGTLGIQISGNQNSQLQINGSVTLGGKLMVASSTPLSLGSQFTFINSTGPIKGEFSSIVMPSPELRGRLVIVGDPQAVLIVAPASYTQVAINQNQTNVTRALNSFIPAVSGDQVLVSTALDSLTVSQYQQAFNAIMPTIYQSMSTTAFNLANAQNSELIQRLWGLRIAGTGFSMSGFADNTPVIEGQGDGDKGVLDSKRDILRPGADNHWGMFLDGNGIFARANSANMLPSYNSQSGGVTTGFTYKWNENFGTGIYAGYEGSYTKYSGGSTIIDNSVRFGLFGTYGQKNAKGEAVGFYADGLAGGGYNNYQVTRNISFPGLNRTANSSPGAGELDTMLATGYDFKRGNWTYGPTTSLQYTYFGANAVNETGAQSLNFASGGWNSSSMLSSVGAHAAYNWQACRDILVIPQVSLNWQHEFLQNPYAINGNLGGTSPSFSNTSATGIRDYLYTGVGFTVEFAKRWNTSFFYNASAGNNNLVSQNIFWSAGLKF